MTHIIGLFSDQVQAEAAVDALVKANLDGVDIRTIDQGNGTAVEGAVVAPAVAPAYGVPGAAVPVVAVPAPEGIPADEWQFFQRNIQQGGVLVVVEATGEETIAQVQHILQAHGGRLGK